ncbi:MAG: sensor domain-containing protein [Actinomycetota bacterium]
MSDDDPLPNSVDRWLGVIGLVIAPTTLVSGLCYYFGYVSARKSMAYLGIDSDAVGFSTQDYVTKSVGVLFVLILIALLAATTVGGLRTAIRCMARNDRYRRPMRCAALVIVAAGVTVVARGAAGVLMPTRVWIQTAWATPAALGLGAALILLGIWIVRTPCTITAPLPPTPAERGMVITAAAVLALALFWSMNIYATKAGEVEGTNIAGNLWFRESTVILDTPDRLSLPPQLVRQTVLTPADGLRGETYRYECLRVVAVRDHQWVLLPANWRPQFGYALFVTADATHHITLRTIKDAPERVGGGSNVREYWPCPEVVPITTGPQVQNQLLGLDDLRRVVGTPTLLGITEYAQTLPDAQPADSKCIGAIDPTARPMTSDIGFVARYGRRVTEPSPLSDRVDEMVVQFDTPHHAADYVAALREDWNACAGTSLAIQGDTSEIATRATFGEPGDGNAIPDDIAVLPFELEGADDHSCSHVVGAKSNVAADVVACGDASTTKAVAVVNAIRQRFVQ